MMIEETYSFPSRVGQLFHSHPNQPKISPKLTATSVESDESWLIQSTLSPLIENISNLSQANLIPTTKKGKLSQSLSISSFNPFSLDVHFNMTFVHRLV